MTAKIISLSLCVGGARLFLPLIPTFSIAASDALALERGRAVYEQHCAACHGATGDGNGPASVWLYPKPRDFSAGLFKIKSTPGQALPTDEDLFQSVTRGLPGSSMPSFSYLSELECQEVVHDVKFMTARIDANETRINLFEQAAENNQLSQPVVVPPEPAADVRELTFGREVYNKMQCNLCFLFVAGGPPAEMKNAAPSLFIQVTAGAVAAGAQPSRRSPCRFAEYGCGRCSIIFSAGGRANHCRCGCPPGALRPRTNPQRKPGALSASVGVGRFIRRMTKTFGNELLEAEVNLHQVEEGAKQHLAPLRAIGRAVFEHWAALNWKLTCVKALPFAPPYCGGN